jgi:hypothetical protein
MKQEKTAAKENNAAADNGHHHHHHSFRQVLWSQDSRYFIQAHLDSRITHDHIDRHITIEPCCMHQVFIFCVS